MKQRAKMLISFILAILMVFSILNPFSVYAEEEEISEVEASEEQAAEEVQIDMEIPMDAFTDYESIRTEENEVQSLRTPNSKTYKIDDENMQMVIYTEDIHYPTASGFEEISNTIVESASQYGSTQYQLTNEANAYSANFADLGEDELVRINYGSVGISITPVTETEAEQTVEPLPDEEMADEELAEEDVVEEVLPEEGAIEEVLPEEGAIEEVLPEEGAIEEVLPEEGAIEEEILEEESAEEGAIEGVTTEEPAEGELLAVNAEEPVTEVNEVVNAEAQILADAIGGYEAIEESNELRQLVFPENSVLYENVLPDVDLIYETQSDKVKEYIVLREATDTNEFLFDYKLYDLTVQTNEYDQIVFKNEAGDVVFITEDLFALDNAGAYTEEVSCTVESIEGDVVRIKVELDEQYLADPARVYPIMIDPSVMLTGTGSTYDSYVSEASPDSNYYLSENLKVGRIDGNDFNTYIKFDMNTSVTASQVTNAKIRLKYRSGATPSGLYGRRVISAWDSTTVKWNNRPNVATAETTGNTSLVAVEDGANWYCMHVTTFVRKVLEGAWTNRGWRVTDPGLTNSTTTFYSSDYGSPYRPELVIDYTASSTPYYGNRTYVKSSSYDQNCFGFAWNVNANIKANMFPLSEAQKANVQTSDDFNLLVSYIRTNAINYMKNRYGLTNSDYGLLSQYNSTIPQQSYRVALRAIGFDVNNDGVFDYDENPASLNSDYWDFHWWYQTDTGKWAEKNGSFPSQVISATSGSTNPSSSSSASLWAEYANGSNVLYMYIANS